MQQLTRGGVAMATKVVKGFKEKVINIVKCSGEFQSDQDRISLWISGLAGL
jgi:hypothetical protein